jgi:hypothetical protein
MLILIYTLIDCVCVCYIILTAAGLKCYKLAFHCNFLGTEKNQLVSSRYKTFVRASCNLQGLKTVL